MAAIISRMPVNFDPLFMDPAVINNNPFFCHFEITKKFSDYVDFPLAFLVESSIYLEIS
jgi:hypothetical protein